MTFNRLFLAVTTIFVTCSKDATKASEMTLSQVLLLVLVTIFFLSEAIYEAANKIKDK